MALGLINQHLEQLPLGAKPTELYDPIRYILSLGGKRLRPVLVLLGHALFDKDFERSVKPAVAVEVFHNFTLMHDDIMDKAPLRRGMPTVHEKWNSNIAILSGDVMLVKAYELLMDIPPEKMGRVISLFNQCAAEVCEGQQWDMNYETVPLISVGEYLEMIRLKTAVLLGLSLQMGALLGGASEEEADLFRAFGVNIGVAFQLKDDLLDVYGDQAKFGKQVGGDILANKKTFLLIKALQDARGEQHRALLSWIEATNFNPEEKVTEVTKIYDALQIQEKTWEQIRHFHNMALQHIARWEGPEASKQVLAGFMQDLMDRDR